MQITIGGRPFSWTFSRAARRSVQLRLIGPDTLSVIAPLGYSRTQVEEIIRAKENWIIRHAAKLAAQEHALATFSVEPGSSLPYLGKAFTLAVAYHPVRPSVRLDGSLIRVCLPETSRGDQAKITDSLVRFYIKEAHRYLGERTNYWSKQIGVNPAMIKIGDAKTRWGSCSSKGNINYCWRIMLAPSQIADYLVIHELCHLREPNHSARFWQLVETYCPEFRNCRSWLKQNGGMLMRLFSF